MVGQRVHGAVHRGLGHGVGQHQHLRLCLGAAASGQRLVASQFHALHWHLLRCQPCTHLVHLLRGVHRHAQVVAGVHGRAWQHGQLLIHRVGVKALVRHALCGRGALQPGHVHQVGNHGRCGLL